MHFIYKPLLMMVRCWKMSIFAITFNDFIFFSFLNRVEFDCDVETPGPIVVLLCVCARVFFIYFLNFLSSNLSISFLSMNMLIY